MSDTPESVREVVTGLYWADAKLSEVRAAIEALERYAELLEQHAALKARVEICEREHWVLKPLSVQDMESSGE